MSSRFPKTSVIICTRNRVAETIRCINSVIAQTLAPDEIVVVDAGGTDELSLKLDNYSQTGIKILYTHTEPGLTYQRNVGTKISSGDIVFFFDDDVTLEKDYLEEVVRVYQGDEENKVGGVTGQVIMPGSGIRLILRNIYGILRGVFFLSTYGSGKFQPSGSGTICSGSQVQAVEFLCGCASYRREVLNAFQFDENLQGYAWGEDADFSYRVSRKYLNVYTPYARLTHYVSPTARDRLYARAKMGVENHYYLFKKNIPQTIWHKCAFWWSVVGMFVMEMLNMVRFRSIRGLQGFIAGLINVSRKRVS